MKRKLLNNTKYNHLSHYFVLTLRMHNKSSTRALYFLSMLTSSWHLFTFRISIFYVVEASPSLKEACLEYKNSNSVSAHGVRSSHFGVVMHTLSYWYLKDLQFRSTHVHVLANCMISRHGWGTWSILEYMWLL